MAQAYVVIAVRNRSAYTHDCLALLADQTLPHTVVVVDGGSCDGTPEMIEATFPTAILLRGNGELWWTGATNVGVGWVLAHCAADDWVVTLNDDTLPTADYLERLTRPAADHPKALLGSIAVKVDEPSVVVDGGVSIDWWRAKFVIRHGGISCSPNGPHGCLYPVDVLSGCGTLVPVRAFTTLGPYNARLLPHYGADYEFSRRAAVAGYELLVNDDAVLQRRADTGIHADVRRGNIKALTTSLVSRRSATNLAARVNFALLAAPRSALLPYVLCDVGRVLAGSIRRFAGRHQ